MTPLPSPPSRARAAAHPDATVEVLIDFAYRDIVADRLDAGIRLGEKLERDMIALRVGPELRMAVVATPAYLAQSGPIDHPGDLTRHRCINYRMVAAVTVYAWEFERYGQRSDVRVAGPLTFNEPELMLEAALGGSGVGYLLGREAARHVREGRLVHLPADWAPPFPGFHLITRRDDRCVRCWRCGQQMPGSAASPAAARPRRRAAGRRHRPAWRRWRRDAAAPPAPGWSCG